MSAAEDQARAALAAFDLYWTDGGPVDPAYGRPYELIRALLAERQEPAPSHAVYETWDAVIHSDSCWCNQEPAPSGMTREALAEVLSPFVVTTYGDARDTLDPANAILAASSAVRQEPAAVRPLDRVTDEMVAAAITAYDDSYEVDYGPSMRAALEAALAHRTGSLDDKGS